MKSYRTLIPHRSLLALLPILIVLLDGAWLPLSPATLSSKATMTRAHAAERQPDSTPRSLTIAASDTLTVPFTTSKAEPLSPELTRLQSDIFLPMVVRSVMPKSDLFSISISVVPGSILADGSSTTSIAARVEGSAVVEPAGYTIIFETTHGTFSNGNRSILITTDTTGVAQTTLTSVLSIRDISATVTVRVEGPDNQEFTDSRTVLFQALTPDPAQVLVTTVPGRIPADEQTTAEVVAVVRNANNAPVSNHSVIFRTTLGTFSNGEKSISGMTDKEGQAQVELIAPEWSNRPVQATLTVQASNRAGENLIGTTTIWFDSPEPEPFDLRLRAEPEPIPINASRTIPLTAELRTTDGEPIPNHRVTFKTTHGTFSNNQASIQQTTSISGGVAATLDIAWVEDDLQATVQVSAITQTAEDDQRVVYDEANIWFEPPDPDAFQLFLATETGRIPANGTSQTTLIATLTGVVGEPLANYPVTFETTHGTFTSGNTSIVQLTDENGQASVVLQSAFSATPIEASVTAQVSTDTGNEITQTTNVWFTVPSQVFVSAVPQSIPATESNMAAIIATVLDDTGTPLANYAVDFITTLGTFEGGGSVTRVNSNASGEAIANLYAAPTLNAALVTVQVGQEQISDQTYVEFVASEQHDIEPNDLPIEASQLEQGVYLGSFQGEAEGEDDYYLVYLNALQALRLELTSIPAGADYDMILYDSTLTYVAYSNEYSNVNEYIDYVKTSGELEPYYLRINQATRTTQAQNTYILKLTISNIEGATAAPPSLEGLLTPDADMAEMQTDPELPPKPGE